MKDKNCIAPNITKMFNDTSENHKKNPLEIHFQGYFYDVSDFADKHPGGNIIKFYTDKSEDATHAIEQFHFRSSGKVQQILKSLRKREATPEERGHCTNALKRSQNLTSDFNELYKELKYEGYFEPSICHVILRITEAVAFILLSLGIFHNCQTTLSKFLAAIFVGFAYSRQGWLQHEAGHNSLTGRPKLDKFIQIIFVSFTVGGSPAWWNSQHNRHHAMPQRLEHDVDLATLPYVAFHKRAVKDPKEINTIFIRFQGIFYWTIDLLIAVFAWRFIIHPRYSYQKKAYHELALSFFNTFTALYSVGPFWLLVCSYWFSLFLGINFALSHSYLSVTDKPTHWVEYAFTHTVNVKSSMFVDYFMGYLNFQIEHHLFPTMPQYRQKEISHRVKALAEKHGLPYRSYGYIEAVSLAIKNLHQVGQTLTASTNINSNTI